MDKNKKTILIIGGSLGSKKLNEVIFPIIKDLVKKFNIIHITGKGNAKIKAYEKQIVELTNEKICLKREYKASLKLLRASR